MQEIVITITRPALIILSLLMLGRLLRSMLSDRYEEEVWAYLRVGETLLPVCHWENIIGKGLSADLRVFGRGIGRTHAVLSRNDRGVWSVYDVFSKGGVWVNSVRVPKYGARLRHGDLINLGGSCVTFLTCHELEAPERVRRVNPALTLFVLSLFQGTLLAQHWFSIAEEHRKALVLAFLALICLEWLLYEGMRLLGRNGFEVETLSFYLTTIGLSVAASSTPEDLVRQLLLILTGTVLFAAGGWWLSSLRRTRAMRLPVGILALALLALNVVGGYSQYGASNWLSIGGYSFQPSEFVKVCYIYAGAATLEMLYRKRNLYVFILFSAVCVMALALIGDFGTALVFFGTFLVISFMRSGSIATVLLAVAGAVMAGFLAIMVKPYIATRFASFGHAWEDIYNTGYQQTRAMSAAASGGLLGKGAGNGWLKTVFAANTDMVFAFVAEELGLIVAVCMVLSVVLMAFFAVRETRRGRSAYYGIAACATMAMLLIQLSLNVFGSLDLLPFTGVTFPFVSRGGSSLLCCWMLMAFLKSADNRPDSSFAVKNSGYDIDEQEEPDFPEEEETLRSEEYGQDSFLEEEDGTEEEEYGEDEGFREGGLWKR